MLMIMYAPCSKLTINGEWSIPGMLLDNIIFDIITLLPAIAAPISMLFADRDAESHSDTTSPWVQKKWAAFWMLLGILMWRFIFLVWAGAVKYSDGFKERASRMWMVGRPGWIIELGSTRYTARSRTASWGKIYDRWCLYTPCGIDVNVPKVALGGVYTGNKIRLAKWRPRIGSNRNKNKDKPIGVGTVVFIPSTKRSNYDEVFTLCAHVLILSASFGYSFRW